MARQISLLDTVKDAQGAQTGTPEPEKAAPAPRKRAQSPRKKSATKSAASKPKAAQKATKPTPAPEASGEAQELPPRVPYIRGVKTEDAVRLNLYLHPDDAEWLRTEGPRGTTQNVFRAMIAVMRHNQQVAKQVSKLSASGPRGEH